MQGQFAGAAACQAVHPDIPAFHHVQARHGLSFTEQVFTPRQHLKPPQGRQVNHSSLVCPAENGSMAQQMGRAFQGHARILSCWRDNTK